MRKRRGVFSGRERDLAHGIRVAMEAEADGRINLDDDERLFQLEQCRFNASRLAESLGNYIARELPDTMTNSHANHSVFTIQERALIENISHVCYRALFLSPQDTPETCSAYRAAQAEVLDYARRLTASLHARGIETTDAGE